jgi:2-polyprenyl-3-methyl-5-hydroxy-6-metoxy-1,4-benzoquinol methylase
MKQLERLTNCPLCKSGLFLNHNAVKDFSVSKETFNICHCTECQLLFTNPRPKEEHVGSYYQSEEYISHQNKANNPINILYKAVRYYTIKSKVKWLNHHNKNKGVLLDIGCGTGHFLKAAKKSGWEVRGVEPNKQARKIAKKKNLKVQSEISKLDKNQKFDCITLYHVLEHIHSLRKTGKRLNKMLKTGGTLFIAVPIHDSYDSKYYHTDWAGWDVPRHLYHFTQKTVDLFASTFGFTIVETIPMKFDSFYVSLLSEKNSAKENNTFKQFLNGFRIGLKSNISAKRNKGNYSSLLFILKK